MITWKAEVFIQDPTGMSMMGSGEVTGWMGTENSSGMMDHTIWEPGREDVEREMEFAGMQMVLHNKDSGVKIKRRD